jgi:parallel beta-helix repeat protein
MDAPPNPQNFASDTKEKHLKRLSFRLGCVLAGSLLAAACGSDNNGNVVSITTAMNESQISAAFSNAAADSTISFAAGTYHFTNSLNLASKNNITVKGAGMGSTILDWSGQTAGADGVVQANTPGSTIKAIFQDFSITDTIGDGLKVTGAGSLHVKGVGVSWPTRTTHGGYGVYPVQSKQVLVENCTVDGASDTGIYVGQSDGIVVRNNTLTNNVAGIEIENSFNADVTGNNSHDNTVGFLVFDLPNLPQVGGHNIRVYSNQFVNNNHANFGDHSGTVALVPAGTGGAVMANSKVEVFGNTFTGNTAIGFGIISCFVAFPTNTCLAAAAGYNPFPNNISVHDNTFTNNGTNPLQGNTDTNHPSYMLAALLASGFQGSNAWKDGHVSDVSYDGVLGLGASGNAYSVCAKTNGNGHFANMHFDQVEGGANLGDVLTFDEAAYSCVPNGFPLPAVPVPAF